MFGKQKKVTFKFKCIWPFIYNIEDDTAKLVRYGCGHLKNVETDKIQIQMYIDYIDIHNTDNDTAKTVKYMEARETGKIKTQIYIYMYIILATIQ